MEPQFIIAAIQAAIQLITLARQAAETAKQDKEWTPEQEAAVDAAIAKIGTKPWDIDTGK